MCPFDFVKAEIFTFQAMQLKNRIVVILMCEINITASILTSIKNWKILEI